MVDTPVRKAANEEERTLNINITEEAEKANRNTPQRTT